MHDPKSLVKELKRRIAQRKLYTYEPYIWQKQFHDAGATCSERMAMAANRVGKTRSAAAEVAFHATGDYPEWWAGKRFNEPVLVWVGSVTNEASRDIVQKELLGGMGEELGTGFIPGGRIIGKPATRQAGIAGVVDHVKVRHSTGGVSTIVFKTYDQGWKKWQGTAPHVVWMDEEPAAGESPSAEDYRIFTEAQTRILTSHGILMVTFTPLNGTTTLVEHFQKGLEGTFVIGATWDDAPHLSEKDKNDLSARYPDYELEARTKGIPMMGEGRVFITPEEEIKIPPFEIPSWFARIKGVDFGIDHPSAVCDLAWDRDKDVVYVTRVWRKRNAESEEHSQAINEVNPWVPVAWPHDGTNREKRSGERLKDAYVQHGVRMLGKSARYKNDVGGGQPVEPIVLETQERARNGGLKVFNTCTEFFDEYRNYHRKDGKIVPVRDDALKAFFYALMMRRYAITAGMRYPVKQRASAPVVSVKL